MFHGFERVEKVEHLDLLEFHLPKSVPQDPQLLLNCTVKSQVQTSHSCDCYPIWIMGGGIIREKSFKSG